MIIRIFIWIVFIVGGSVLSIYFDRLFFNTIWNNQIWHTISFIIGIILLKIVIKISSNTGKILAKFGKKGDKLPKLETNRIVKKGVYSCMRHPMHLGLLFFPLSIGFLLGAVSFIIIIAPLEIVIIIIMIYLIEEPEANKKFGAEYSKYKKQTPFFNFKIECLKKLFENH